MDWYGLRNMNRLFEQDNLAELNLKMQKYVSKIYSPPENLRPQDPEMQGLWIRDILAESVWSSNDENAHLAVTGEYSKEK